MSNDTAISDTSSAVKFTTTRSVPLDSRLSMAKIILLSLIASGVTGVPSVYSGPSILESGETGLRS